MRNWSRLVLSAVLVPAAMWAEPLTPEKVLDRRGLSDVRWSPDGTKVAFVVAEPIRGADQNLDIWLYDETHDELRRLTTSEEPDRSPRWSPDGQTLAFISERTDPPQIYLLSMRGGEARALTDGKTGVTRFAWSPDGSAIAFLAPEPRSEEDEERIEDKDDARVVDKDDRPPQLWRVDIASGDVSAPSLLTTGAWRISSFDWHPDGDRLIVAATDDPQPELETTRMYTLSTSVPALLEIARPLGPFGDLSVSPDGATVAYVGSRDSPTPHDLYVQPLSGGAAKNLTAKSIDRPVAGYHWREDGTLLVRTASSMSTRFFVVSLDGGASRKPALEETHALGAFDVSGDRLAFVGESETAPQELWIAELDGVAAKKSAFNASWSDVELVAPQMVSYPSFDRTTIEAALLTPPGRGPSERVPLIVLVHGGPTGRWSARFHAWGQLLVARGYAVLYPNVRGSTGYGHDFLTANREDWGGGDFRDVMAGVDDAIEKGIADPDRLAIGGWSYGGYMAAWAVTQTDRFAAAVAGAPMTDLASEYGTEASGINAYDTWFLGNPYENQAHFVERSPITHVRNAKTPTLIPCGENDRTDPIGQCTQFYRGLRRYGVDAELVIYPREGHRIREEKHRLDLLRRVVEWFDTRLASGS